MSDFVICSWCLRKTTREPRHGRRTRRHKCPHGVWCPRSDKLRQHDNHYPMGGRSCCDECRKAYWVREHERIQAGTKLRLKAFEDQPSEVVTALEEPQANVVVCRDEDGELVEVPLDQIESEEQ